jgi:VWFA-related protein
MTVTRAALIVAGLVASQWAVRGQDLRFHSSADAVAVSVSVLKGNRPVLGLGASDFSLSDDGEPQQVRVVSIEALPVDVSLFIDTSMSTGAALDAMQTGGRRLGNMLRDGDRFRLLTIGHSVYETIPWTDAGHAAAMNLRIVGGISLVYDAVAAALMHAVAPGRRHLVIALTDGLDCGSVVSPALLQEVAGRSDAVLHWIVVSGNSMVRGTLATCDDADPDPGALRESVLRTGGQVHAASDDVDPVKAFSKIFDEFRHSYVLYYAPQGIAPTGWHTLHVTVPGQSLTIHARSGYFAG